MTGPFLVDFGRPCGSAVGSNALGVRPTAVPYKGGHCSLSDSRVWSMLFCKALTPFCAVCYLRRQSASRRHDVDGTDLIPTPHQMSFLFSPKERGQKALSVACARDACLRIIMLVYFSSFGPTRVRSRLCPLQQALRKRQTQTAES
jgi:hypothetical protein